MRGKDLIAATLFGGAGGSSSGGGIPQADIDAAFAALAEKGVTVPDGSTSADLDDLIASIVTGGGKYYTETVIPAEDCNENDLNAEMELDYSDPPSVIIVYSQYDGTQQASGTSGYACSIKVFKEILQGQYPSYTGYSWFYHRSMSKHYAPYVRTETFTSDKKVRPIYSGLGVTYRAGVPYKFLYLWGVTL